jgi:hypothetical protein
MPRNGFGSGYGEADFSEFVFDDLDKLAVIF